MNTYGISKRSFIQLLKTFKQFPEIKEVVLFGSRAMGNYHKGSDIDLALIGDKVDPQLIFRLKTLLNHRLNIPYKTDLVGFRYLTHKALKKHIISVGKSVYVAN